MDESEVKEALSTIVGKKITVEVLEMEEGIRTMVYGDVDNPEVNFNIMLMGMYENFMQNYGDDQGERFVEILTAQASSLVAMPVQMMPTQ